MKFNSLIVLTLVSTIVIGSATFPLWRSNLLPTFISSQAGSHSQKQSIAAPESINCPGPMVLAANSNCQAEVILTPPVSTCGNITAMSYIFSGNNVTVVLTSPFPTSINLGFWPYGKYNVTWNVRDDCPPLPTSAICNQLIVIDDIDPVITCPADVSVGNNEDGRRSNNGNRMMFTPVNVGQPTATDNCTPAADISFTHNSPYSSDPNDASGEYPLGTTVVCWTATDISGNSASCCMNIIVYDYTPVKPENVAESVVPPQPEAVVDGVVLVLKSQIKEKDTELLQSGIKVAKLEESINSLNATIDPLLSIAVKSVTNNGSGT